MMSGPGRVRKVWIALPVVLGVLGWMAAPSVGTARLLADLAGGPAWARKWLPARTVRVDVRDLDLNTREGRIALRAYEPATPDAPTVLVIPGLHAGGVEEPRLVALASRLAATGVRVITLPLPDLRRFRVLPRDVDIIEDVARTLSEPAPRTPPRGIGLVGVSFGGGLALAASARARLAGRLTFVLSIGGYSDLRRVLAYLAGTGAATAAPPPHPYGIAVLLLSAAAHVVPAEQAGPLDNVLVEYLDAGSRSNVDPERAAREGAEARRHATELPEPAATYARQAFDGDADALRPVLEPWLDTLSGEPALSLERLGPPLAPVFLLHGADDPLIPATEADRAYEDIRRRGAFRVRRLVTPVLTHADAAGDAGLADVVRLISFWNGVRAAADAPPAPSGARPR